MQQSRRSLTLSALGHTWILDLDGTIVKHNGYIIDGHDTLLEGAREFLERIPKEDMLIFLTSRTEDLREMTERFLEENGISYDYILFGAPYGERILINDAKPSGLHTALAVSCDRDALGDIEIIIDEEK